MQEDGHAPKFVIFGNSLDGYWWRLRSASGETLAVSGRAHPCKAQCEGEVYRLKEECYPTVMVRDASIAGPC